MKISFQCRICAVTSECDLHAAREIYYATGEEFDYIECASCGSVQIKEIPRNIEEYYPADYYSLQPYSTNRKFWHVLSRQYSKLHWILKSIVFSRSGKPLAQLDLRPNSRILDVGCGRGDRLALLSLLGFRNLCGAEPHIESDIASPLGFNVLKKSIHEVKGEWDFVLFNHSFEHLPDPVESIMAVSRLLAPNGVCMIKMPTASSFAWKHYRVNWIQLDPPRHLHLLTVGGVEALARRCGLQLTRTMYDSTFFQFSGSEMSRQGRRVAGVSPLTEFSKAEFQGFIRRAKHLDRKGQGDQAAFFLRRAN